MLYVTYSFATVTGTGVGRMQITGMRSIRTFSDVEKIEAVIRQDNPKFTNVFLLTWQPLEEECTRFSLRGLISRLASRFTRSTG